MSDTPESVRAMAAFFHDTYERLAPHYGYETRLDTRVFDPESPNGRLMQAVCAHWLAIHAARIRELEAQLKTSMLSEKDVLHAADTRIRELEAQITAHEAVCAGSWVPVTERLPSARGDYLCIIEDIEFPDRPPTFAYFLWLGQTWAKQVFYRATHWLDAREPK